MLKGCTSVNFEQVEYRKIVEVRPRWCVCVMKQFLPLDYEPSMAVIHGPTPVCICIHVDVIHFTFAATGL